MYKQSLTHWCIVRWILSNLMLWCVGNKVDTVVSLLLQTQDAHSARQLQESNLRGKRIEKKNVQHEMVSRITLIFPISSHAYVVC